MASHKLIETSQSAVNTKTTNESTRLHIVAESVFGHHIRHGIISNSWYLRPLRQLALQNHCERWKMCAYSGKRVKLAAYKHQVRIHLGPEVPTRHVRRHVANKKQNSSWAQSCKTLRLQLQPPRGNQCKRSMESMIQLRFDPYRIKLHGVCCFDHKTPRAVATTLGTTLAALAQDNKKRMSTVALEDS
eukprot:4061311-Amphidinium_carterae.1